MGEEEDASGVKERDQRTTPPIDLINKDKNVFILRHTFV